MPTLYIDRPRTGTNYAKYCVCGAAIGQDGWQGRETIGYITVQARPAGSRERVEVGELNS